MLEWHPAQGDATCSFPLQVAYAINAQRLTVLQPSNSMTKPALFAECTMECAMQHHWLADMWLRPFIGTLSVLVDATTIIIDVYSRSTVTVLQHIILYSVCAALTCSSSPCP